MSSVLRLALAGVEKDTAPHADHMSSSHKAQKQLPSQVSGPILTSPWAGQRHDDAPSRMPRKHSRRRELATHPATELPHGRLIPEAALATDGGREAPRTRRRLPGTCIPDA
ncbi:hypothetical protein GGTG_11390 [Gaeumannomyces tritici R3-111a-1]|uniref:Uncharacterized protein n=1 Tax=Gaeumannomyces tritici (strain R3-111a-1) TaxID=644352 RepID=J3PD17_GAET3|nr:hypothetical protein GGTG_11390 [Gaeumannomyces tritici R3-111a-1]EJT70362.1 hypothetical protein GGTG_11390 [Gaeumannomyces tritici R3-111a-1]